MLTTAILDRDRLSAEVLDGAIPCRGETMPTVREVDKWLRELRARLRQARCRAIRPRGARAAGP